MTASTAPVTPVEQLHGDQQVGIATPSRTRTRAAARRRSPRSAGADGPQRSACRPTQGEKAATTSCGPTRQAPISTVAQWLVRMVSTLPISGSMAALARWKSRRQTPKITSERFCSRLFKAESRLFGGGAGCRGRARDRSPRARDGAKHQHGRHHQRRGDEEHRLRQEEIADPRPSRRRQHRRPMEEKRALRPKPLADRRLADKAEADGGDRRPQHAACRGLHRCRREHHGGRSAMSRRRGRHSRSRRPPCRQRPVRSAPRRTSAPPGTWPISERSGRPPS